jgi:ubiquitin carboxyl-terminal hydrolase 8
MSGYTNGADTSRNGDGSGDSRGPGAPYPPIAEIIASATDTAESLRHHTVLLWTLPLYVVVADRG